MMPGTGSGGAILVARHFFESWSWDMTGDQIKVFLYLLYRARWKRGVDRWWDGHEVVEIPRGAAVISTEKAAKACHVSRKTVRRTIEILSKTGTLEAYSRANRWTFIRFLKYESYQDGDSYRGQPSRTQGANRGPTEGQPRATDENQVVNQEGKKESVATGLLKGKSEPVENSPPTDRPTPATESLSPGTNGETNSLDAVRAPDGKRYDRTVGSLQLVASTLRTIEARLVERGRSDLRSRMLEHVEPLGVDRATNEPAYRVPSTLLQELVQWHVSQGMTAVAERLRTWFMPVPDAGPSAAA